MAKLCYSYVRFSSVKQAQGDSLRRQTALASDWAKQNDYVLDTSLTLHDLGISAFRGKNAEEGALAGFLEAVQSGKVPKNSALVIESLDRLSRQAVGEALNLFLSILRKDVEIITLKPEERFTRKNINDIAKILTAIIYMARSHDESQLKSERIRADFNKKLADKSPSRVPHTPSWLKLVDGKFVMIPERVKAIKKLYKWRQEGLGYSKILDRIREEGIEPFNRTKNWTISYISHLFSSRSLTGEYHPGEMIDGRWTKLDPKFIIPDFYPVVIDRKTFESLQSDRSDKGRIGDNVTNLFTKLVIDPTDGSNYLINKSDSGKTIKCLVPATVIERKKKAFSFPYLTFEKGILKALHEFDVKRLIGTEDQTEVFNSIDSIDRRIELLQSKLVTDDDIDILLPTIKKLKAQKLELKAKIKETVAVDQIESLGQLLEGLKGNELRATRLKARAMMPSIIEKIEMRVFAEKLIQVACCKIVFRSGDWKYLEIFKRRKHYLFKKGVEPEESFVALMVKDDRFKAVDLSRKWEPVVFKSRDWELPKPTENRIWGIGSLLS